MKRKIALLSTVAALALPAGATAKEIEHVEACGAGGCEDVTSIATPAALDGGGRANPPGGAAPFFRVEVKVRAGDSHGGWAFLYVPSAQKVRGDDGTWMNPTTYSLRALDRLVKDVEPFPASDLALPTPGEALAPPPPAATDDAPAAAWAFGVAGVAALLVSGLIMVLRRRGPRPA